ncbi:MAG: hypothetical protein MMC33_001972 [Icmadophila ericetorum]|nr:hypothetical protein [Icmadophila ericetorum]
MDHHLSGDASLRIYWQCAMEEGEFNLPAGYVCKGEAFPKITLIPETALPAPITLDFPPYDIDTLVDNGHFDFEKVTSSHQLNLSSMFAGNETNFRLCQKFTLRIPIELTAPIDNGGRMKFDEIAHVTLLGRDLVDGLYKDYLLFAVICGYPYRKLSFVRTRTLRALAHYAHACFGAPTKALADITELALIKNCDLWEKGDRGRVWIRSFPCQTMEGVQILVFAARQPPVQASSG